MISFINRLLLLLSSTLFFDSFMGFHGFSLYPVMFLTVYMFFFESFKKSMCLIDTICLSNFILSLLLSYVLISINNGVSFEIFKSYASVLSGVLIFICFYKFLSNYNDIVNLINIVLFLHIVILVIQLVIYYCYGYDIDVSIMFHGEGHRPYGASGQYRPTGIFDEPGIYSIFIFSLFIVRYLYNLKLSVFDFFVILSIFLTLSLYGVLLVGIFFIWWVIFALKRPFYTILALTFIVIITISAIYFFSERVIMVLAGSDPSTVSKINIIHYFINEPINWLTGLGLLPIRFWENANFQASGDLTIVLSTILIYGAPIGCMMLINIYILLSNGKINKYVLLALIPLIKLSTFNWIFFWVYLALAKYALFLISLKRRSHNEY